MAPPLVPSAAASAAVFHFSPGPVPREVSDVARQVSPGLVVPGLPDLEAVAAAVSAGSLPTVILTPQLEPGTEATLLRLGADEVLESAGVTRGRLAAARARAEARHARREATERRARVFEALTRLETSAVLSLDPSLIIQFASDGVRRLFGYEPGDLVGRPATDLVLPEGQAEVREYFRRALEHPGQPLAGTALVRAAGGQAQRVSGHVLNLLEDPAVGSLVVAISDAAAEGWRTRQMEESERVFRELADKAPVHIWIEDATRRLTWENRTALEFTGRTWEQEMGNGWLDTLHPEDRPRVAAHYQQTTVVQRGFTLEFRMRRHDGAWRHLLQIAIPRWDALGVFVGFLGVDVDVTELKEAGQRLEQAEARYRLFVEQSTEGIWRFEVDDPIPLTLPEDEVIAAIFERGWLAECNQAMARQYGVEDAGTLLGFRLRDLLSPEDPRNVAMLRQFVQGGFRLADAESHERDREGRTKVFLNTLVGIIDGGHLARAWGTQRDITLQRQLEEEARQSRKMETAGRLAGGIAHDFNNLLTAILGTSELLLGGLALGSPEREDVEEIKRAATRAANLTRQLLAFSRRQVLQPRTIELDQLVQGVESLVRRLIGEHITLRTATVPGLWRVRADPGQLEQVIVNLCVNARDAMPTGGSLLLETANVLFPGAAHGPEAIMPAGAYVLFTVTDSGTGMDPQTLRHIFEPFFTTKEPGRGTGLGLATVYGIVKQSDGFVFVDTEVGRGSRFRIYLPRVEGAAEPVEAPPDPPTTRASGTILLVEDEAAVRRLARRVLEDVGYTVLEAADGPEALRLTERWEGDIDLVVTDVIMPGMSGQELSARLRASRPWLRIMYVSGYTDDTILQHGTLLPNTSFLQKPFTPGVLAQRVAEAMR
ncbi:MAG: PAS domain S-box protein [Gemmatimonadetes bacterium]|nr:PAS domain S-box protein [Gemmatimonadota bacterium]